ncbi:MAG TPA: hypothetical protein VIM98_00095 [Dyella sp.]|uniref:hypothetical protein n=1 Tax=Dyella sp. TaxID=1869338 RepID=UPI002F930272
MADANDTAYARPTNPFGAIPRPQTWTHPADLTLAQINGAMFTAVQFLALAVAERDGTPNPSVPHSYRLGAHAVDGLTVMMSVLSERADALCRREGPGA